MRNGLLIPIFYFCVSCRIVKDLSKLSNDRTKRATGFQSKHKPGNEVRLKGGYIIKATRVEKDTEGNITTIFAEYDTDSKSGSGSEASMRKVKGTLHWVSATENLPIDVRLYDRLFTVESPDAEGDGDFLQFVNPDSMIIVQGFAEPSLRNSKPEDKFQFQRIGYFTLDKDSTEDKYIFNRTVGLRDTWAKEQHK